MSEFDNVTVVREANIYFDGKVTSRTVVFADGSKKTLGIMLPGEFTFSTQSPECMELLCGEVEVLLPGEDIWSAYKAGTTFNVPGSSKFQIRVLQVTDYCCSYLAS